MNHNSQALLEVEDESTFFRFVNLAGEISKALYLEAHPEENDELPTLL